MGGALLRLERFPRVELPGEWKDVRAGQSVEQGECQK